MDKSQGAPTTLNPEYPALNPEILAFVEELRSSDDGWQRCCDYLTSHIYQDDRFRFLCFQTIEYYLKSNYSKASLSEQDYLKHFLFGWIRYTCDPNHRAVEVYVRNKAAQIFALVFINDFPLRWPTFIPDIIETVGYGPKAVDHFLRVLKAIDSEIADREMTYTDVQIQRNTLIKNAMRESSVEQLVQCLYDIMNMYELSYPELCSLALETLSMYIHWIDIGLVANELFMGTLQRLLSSPSIRESVVVCIQSIVLKGMDPLEKFNLVESVICILNNVVFHRDQDDDSEFCTKLAHLANSIGLALLESYAKFQKNGQEEQLPVIVQAIDVKVPILITFLGNDYDDVSSAVLDFAKDYVHFLKGRPSLSDQQIKNAQQLLVTTVHKMKYDESYKFDHEGEDEAEFLEFRKSLKVIFDNLVGLNKDMVLSYVMELGSRTLREWRTVPFADVEVSLAVLYFVGEALPTHAGQYSPEDHIQLLTLVYLALESGVSSHPHSAVSLQFFEVMVRYERILLPTPPKILSTIDIFLSTCGLRHLNPKVRSRSAYLFSKFIKGSKSVIQAYTKDILLPLQALLAMNSGPLNGGKEEWMSSDDQLFLFEAAGILIVSSALTNQEKVTAFKDLLLPFMCKFNRFVKEIAVESDVKRQEVLANSMCHVISITTRTSKAFTTQVPMKSIGCVGVYVECLDIFLTSLQVSVQSSMIQNSVRQFLHRMVVCLDSEILPYIPRATQELLKSNDIRSLQEYIPLIVQIIYKFKKEVQPFLQECLTPIVTAIFAVLAAPLEESDEDGKAEKYTLKKLYFQFISAVVSNVVGVLHDQPSKVKKDILFSVTECANDPLDPVIQKNCFSILRKLVESSGEQPGDDFIQFIYEHVIRVCLDAPARSANISQVLGDSAACLKVVYSKRGDEMLSYLETAYMASAPPLPLRVEGFMEEFRLALNSDVKTLKTFLNAYYKPNS